MNESEVLLLSLLADTYIVTLFTFAHLVCVS